MPELVKARWTLLAIFIAAFILAWFVGPLMWAFAIVVLVLLVRTEWTLRKARRE